MLSCASIDAQRDYKLISIQKPPKTPINKGFSLAHACAECAQTCARARYARTLARSLRSRATMRSEHQRARYARVLPCGMKSWQRRGQSPPHPRAAPGQLCHLRTWGTWLWLTAIAQDPQALRFLRSPSASIGWAPAKARAPIVYLHAG